MTRVLVNAVSVREGGPLAVLRHLLPAMAAQEPTWRWHVVAPLETALVCSAADNVRFEAVDPTDTASWRVRWWYERALPRLVQHTEADVVFSQTNYLPARALPCPALLLVQHAGHFSDDFDRATRAAARAPGALAWRLKRSWVRQSARRAQRVTVQTQALAQRLEEDAGVEPARIDVVPHGPGQVARASAPVAAAAPGAEFRVGYVTKHGVQKNFGVLFRAVARLQSAGTPTRLVLTLPAAGAETRAVLAHAAACGIAASVENHGDLDPDALARVYRGLHAFVFPSWCESFGFPMVEAMASGVPLLAADTASNREIAGRGAQYFGAGDDEGLAALLQDLARDAAAHERLARAALQRAGDYSWERAAAETLASLRRTLEARA